MNAYAEILERAAENVVRRGERQSDARCPAHEDRKPSLSIGAGADRVFVKCQAGCRTEDVVAQWGLPMSALFDAYWQSNGNGNGNGRAPIAATYQYVDERKRLLFEVVRREDKSFAQRRPDGAGGWVWKLGDTRRVLYRLPAVIAAVEADARVFVVEGEKDVHAIERAGAVATCNPGGAGKWRPEYGDALRSAHVVVVADRDEPGYRHAEHVAASLERIAAAVRVVQAAEGKDAHDHLSAGRELGDFEPVDGSVDEPKPTKSTASRPAVDGVTFDAKGKLLLPTTPETAEPAELCAWLTVVFALDPTHPITGGAHEGLRGAAGHVVLERLGAPPLRFEPAARINTPMRLIEDLTWQAIPADDPTPPLKGEHCRMIGHVIRRLCGASKAMTDEQETAGIIAAFTQGAQPIETISTHGSPSARYEAAAALQRDADEATGRPVGPARYLIDADTGELVIRVVDLGATARQYVGGSLARGWLDARMENLGWARVRLDGHALPGRAGRFGPHARADVYRGVLALEPGSVTT